MDGKVMIVDDEREVVNVVRAIAEDAGLEAWTATSGPECLAHLRHGFRGVILLDVRMPEMNGWETIRAMAEDGLVEGNVICMLTGMAEPDEGMDGLQEYVVDYVTKPFTRDSILGVVRDHLDHVC